MVRDEEQYQFNYLKRGSDKITGVMEKIYGAIGRHIGKFPLLYIFSSILICGIVGLGMIVMDTTTDPAKLWVPLGSNLHARQIWVEETFIENTRRSVILAVADNVLTPTGIKALYAMYNTLKDVKSSAGVSLMDICLKANKTCIVESILELWAYDKAKINRLTQFDINKDLKNITHSPLFGHPMKLERLLGGVTTTKGIITGATSFLMTFLLHDDYKKRVSVKSWEEAFIEAGQKKFEGFSNVYVISDRSYTDVTLTDGYEAFILTGYFFVACLLVAVLGRVNFIEQKIYLSLAGIFGMAMAMSVSYGFASMIGLEFGPLHTVLPFLFLAIGVDYMFIITRAFTDLDTAEEGYDVVDKTGNILRYAGVTLTSTCFTHCLIFIVCATSLIPTIRSFCIFGAIGIMGIYFMQGVFFTACFSLDIQRQEAKRNACLPCYQHSETYTPIRCEILPLMFKAFSSIMSVIIVKIVILSVTGLLLLINLYGFVKLPQFFDTNWLFPSNSHATLFVEALATHFPTYDVRGYIYCGQMNYFNERKKFERLDTELKTNAYISKDFIDNWYNDMTDWFKVATNNNVTDYLDPANKFPVLQDVFVDMVYRFMKFEQPRLQLNVIFDETLRQILGTRIMYMHPPVSTAEKETDSMNAIADALAATQFNLSVCFPYSSEYFFWDASRTLYREINMNLGYAFIIIFIVTLFGIAHIVTTNFVLLCVVFTMVDVTGTMYYLSLTIEPITNVILIMCIGIALDYSTHFGRLFMMNTGTREERVQTTLMEMGPAILCGSVSLFLAVFPMVLSSSYLYKTTFKLFMMVAVYGTFHGLLFLPCLLSIFGPVAYNTIQPRHLGRPGSPEPEPEEKEKEEPVAASPTKELPSSPMSDRSSQVDPQERKQRDKGSDDDDDDDEDEDDEDED